MTVSNFEVFFQVIW